MSPTVTRQLIARAMETLWGPKIADHWLTDRKLVWTLERQVSNAMARGVTAEELMAVIDWGREEYDQTGDDRYLEPVSLWGRLLETALVATSPRRFARMMAEMGATLPLAPVETQPVKPPASPVKAEVIDIIDNGLAEPDSIFTVLERRARSLRVRCNGCGKASTVSQGAKMCPKCRRR